MLSFIVILKCHNNQNQRESFSIVILPTWYYHKYRDYQKIPRSFISVKYFQLTFTILVPVALLSNIVIISFIMIITLMIYRDMTLLSPIPSEESSSVRRLVGSSSATQQSTAAKGSASTEQTGKILTCNVCTVVS